MPSDVMFTTNPADWTKLEGLYISERDPPGFIRGRDMSVIGFAGKCLRGPLTPQRITSLGRFLEIYGGRASAATDALVGEVWKALISKPFGTIVVRRVLASAAVAGTKSYNDGATPVLKVDATSKGVWGNSVEVKIENATDGDANHFNLTAKYAGREYLYQNLNINGATDDNLARVLGSNLGNVIVCTKLADGRPDNAAYAALTTGSDGTAAAADYIDGVTDLANTDGVSAILVPDAIADMDDVNGEIVALAADVSDRIFLVWSGVHGQDAATEVAAVGAQITTRSDRIVWCYNSAKVRDPVTGELVFVAPNTWMASILSQNDVDVHPGAWVTAKQTAGIRELASESLVRGDLIDLRNAGIATLEKVSGAFIFRSAVTTDLTPGKTELARRRMTDFLQLSASDRLRYFVKSKNTIEVRAQMVGELVSFSEQLRDQGRIIEEFSVESEGVNTELSRGQGEEHILWRVRLIGHILYLVLETSIGTGVVIEQEQAAA